MANRPMKRYFNELANKEKNPVGKLSPELRKALQLKDDMLPFWIYRMRVLGYPPAWMKEAEMSTLSMFDTTAAPSSNATDGEEGEIKDNAQYNKDSLIEFPGFNAPIPENVKDDWLILGMPPLIMKQQLSEAVKTMKLIEPVPYIKRPRLDLSNVSKDDSQITDSPASPDVQILDDSDVILIENESTLNDALNESKKEQVNGDASIDFNTSQQVVAAADESPNDTANDNDTSTDNSERKLKVISMGVPVPASVRPKLPPLENWAVGMGELIHFENLPTSTGAYANKMKGILDKVRRRFDKQSGGEEESN